VQRAVNERQHFAFEKVEFLNLLDDAYPADTAIEVILDNHSAHVSRETTSWLAAQPIGRFTFTPTHGSWLNIIEGFFSKLARAVLRHIRVNSKNELRQRLMAFINEVNREPVVHTWRYKIDDAA
jgi:transposase